MSTLEAPTVLPHAPSAPATSAGRRWSGRLLTGFLALFLLFDGAARIAKFGPYLEGTLEYGFSESHAAPLGLTLIISTLLYLIPRTANLGALLLTAYLGGAIAVHLSHGEPFFFALVFGALVWLARYLLDPPRTIELLLGR